MKKCLVIPLMLFAFNHVQAACLKSYEAYKDVVIQANELSSRGDCFISVTLNKSTNSYYRSFLMSSNGLLMVFLSLGPGDEATSTAAREFYFPSAQTDQITYRTSGNFIWVKVSDQVEFQFSARTADLVAMKNGGVSVNPRFSVANKGGVEITKSPVLFLDSGFKVGSAPSGVKEASSVFTDIARAQCEVKNTEVFRWEGSGDVYPLYKGVAFNRFFSNRCPLLKN